MNQSAIQYRPARAVDANQVHRLYAAAAEEEGALVETPNEISAEIIRNRIRNVTSRRNRLFLVASEDEHIIGMVSLEAHNLLALQHIRYLSVIVEPHFRRRGIGRELMRKAIDWANETPEVEKVELRVRETNESGVTLCKDFGFEIEGRLKRHLVMPSGRRLDDLVMALFVDSTPPHEEE